MHSIVDVLSAVVQAVLVPAVKLSVLTVQTFVPGDGQSPLLEHSSGPATGTPVVALMQLPTHFLVRQIGHAWYDAQVPLGNSVPVTNTSVLIGARLAYAPVARSMVAIEALPSPMLPRVVCRQSANGGKLVSLQVPVTVSVLFGGEIE
ncbi:MAG TPA: hypothetical protein VMW17_00880 [Candidatus Binatia bacterium]|nr:hypothetical protein [Candidatus Binatia bacterium]